MTGNLFGHFKSAFTVLAEGLYPATCVLCGAPGVAGMDLCADCCADLPWLGLCCVRCAMPMDRARLVDSVCVSCRQQPPPFVRCRVAFRYLEPLPYLIGGLKFRDRLDLLRLCGELLATVLPIRDDWQRPECIVPVPLHPRRLRQRGYNQALEIARILGQRLDLPVDARCCARCLPTPPQVGLNEYERAQNMRGAFRALRPLTGARLAVLDDVITTGSTISALAQALYAAGAARVEAWAIARTV